MVLRTYQRLAVLGSFAWVSFGCQQSLFDSHGKAKDSGSDIDALPAETCPAPCLANSGGDFDGTPHGTTERWRYLDDHRDRTWADMSPVDNGFVGADPANTIHKCTPKSDAEACQALPGALLISTAGFTTPADPAIEFTAETNQAIELRLSVHIPAEGFGQNVRIYRNSREDVLFTGPAAPGVTLRQTIALDALAGDRFLVAIAPPAMGQPDIGVQLHVVGANATFPTECQLAIPFATLSGGTTQNACSSGMLTAKHDSTPGTAAPTLTQGPYIELGTAASIAQHNYYSGVAALNRPGDVTLDLWVKHTAVVSPDVGAWIFSELNYQSTGVGGLFLFVYDSNGKLRADAGTVQTAPGVIQYLEVKFDFPPNKGWHFVRLTHKTDGPIKVCVDGVLQGMVTAPGTLKPSKPPHIGQNAATAGNDAAFIGAVDDVRVLNTALPCD